MKIKVPASTSNLGPGFDCLGLALQLYNHFSFEEAEETVLEGFEDAFRHENNLFLQAFRRGCEAYGLEKHIRVSFRGEIPVSRGLGSSAALIVGGLSAAGLLCEGRIPKEQIFQLASRMEGHPDNAAPCVFGGLRAAGCLENASYVAAALPIHPSYRFTCFIPDFEVSTAKARAALPAFYRKEDMLGQPARAILLVQALQNGDLALLKEAARDLIHEPYRKALIHEYDALKDLLAAHSEGAFFISGSGSTCLFVHQEDVKIDLTSFRHHWLQREVPVDEEGVCLEEENE